MVKRKKRATRKVSKAPAKTSYSPMPGEWYKKGGWMLLILGALILANFEYGWWSLEYLLGVVFILLGLKHLFIRPYWCR